MKVQLDKEDLIILVKEYQNKNSMKEMNIINSFSSYKNTDGYYKWDRKSLEDLHEIELLGLYHLCKKC